MLGKKSLPYFNASRKGYERKEFALFNKTQLTYKKKKQKRREINEVQIATFFALCIEFIATFFALCVELEDA